MQNLSNERERYSRSPHHLKTLLVQIGTEQGITQLDRYSHSISRREGKN